MSENSHSRFGSFFDRVQVERAALKIVNANCLTVIRLHGLTEAAINSWLTEAAVCAEGRIHDIEAIASILKRLSCRIDALADQSKVVFSNERFPILVSDEILQELNLACRKS